jgi:hypothetical protein
VDHWEQVPVVEMVEQLGLEQQLLMLVVAAAGVDMELLLDLVEVVETAKLLLMEVQMVDLVVAAAAAAALLEVLRKEQIREVVVAEDILAVKVV